MQLLPLPLPTLAAPHTRAEQKATTRHATHLDLAQEVAQADAAARGQVLVHGQVKPLAALRRVLRRDGHNRPEARQLGLEFELALQHCGGLRVQPRQRGAVGRLAQRHAAAHEVQLCPDVQVILVDGVALGGLQRGGHRHARPAPGGGGGPGVNGAGKSLRGWPFAVIGAGVGVGCQGGG